MGDLSAAWKDLLKSDGRKIFLVIVIVLSSWAYLIFFLYCFHLFFIQEPDEIVLIDEHRKIDHQGIVIKCNPFIQRTRKDGRLLIFIENNVEIEPEFNGMNFRFPDGSKAILEVIFFTRSGKVYFADRLGMGNRDNEVMLRAFCSNEIPKKEKIIKVMIQSTVDFNCSKIAWFCYNAH